MKKIVLKYSKYIASLAILVTAISSGRNCTFIFHQSSLPKAAKKYRKF